MTIKVLDETDIRGKTLFIRADFDVHPDKNYKILEYRLDCVLETINYAVKHDSKLVIASHIDVPGYRYDKHYSLDNIAGILSNKISRNVYFPENCIGDAVKKIKNEMRNGEIMLLENLMFHSSEVNNDRTFAKKLADSIDVYVNESFSLIGRNYASNNAILSYIPEKCVGFSFNNDFKNLNKIKNYGGNDILVYFGNNDISMKLNFLETYIDKVKLLLLGGNFLYSFLNSMGYNIKKHLVDESATYRLKKLFSSFEARNKKILVPEDFYVSQLNNIADIHCVNRKGLKDDLNIHGFGAKTMDIYEKELKENKFIIWDGYFGTDNEFAPEFSKSKLSLSILNNNGFVILLAGSDILSKKVDILYNKRISNISCNITAYKYLEGQELDSLIKLN